MTDPSKLFQQQDKRTSPPELDARILAAARAQAEQNTGKRSLPLWGWMSGVATAAVLVVGITIALNRGLFVSESSEPEVVSETTLFSEADIATSSAERVAIEADYQEQAREVESLDQEAAIAALAANSVEKIQAGLEPALTPEDRSSPLGSAALAITPETGPQEEASLAALSELVRQESLSDSYEPEERIAIFERRRGQPVSREEVFQSMLIDISAAIPGIAVDIPYAGPDNFVGEPIEGYQTASALLTAQALDAVSAAQDELQEQGMGLKIFDAYRPQRAVDHFIRWSQNDDETTKATYYPNIEKSALFEAGYLAERSSHSRGSTVDLTVVKFNEDGTHEELDMGTIFDFFDPSSWPDSTEVSETAQQNRRLLRDLMVKHGFEPFETEWWHFTLRNEPYPDNYFDLPIE